ncbi:MraZ N-terminal domain containing protein [Candidatus Roizmanbacteria bacterium]|nr:MraZ N-terminal domain containing protein [Candidatus Roizmanbacteria bacterium]
MVFFGEYLVSFTGSGRVVLPKKIRELLKGNIFIVTKGFNFCLAGYDRQEWEEKATEQKHVGIRSALWKSCDFGSWRSFRNLESRDMGKISKRSSKLKCQK